MTNENKKDCTYRAIWSFAQLLINVFFKKVEVLHPENIPEHGPLIIVSNHNNQFVDGMMLLKAVKHRAVRFIIAEKSMHRPVIGQLARLVKAVPVIRPQDRAKQGAGTIADLDEETIELIGEDTRFTSECVVGWAITIKGVGTLRIEEIISDTRLRMFDGRPWIVAFREKQRSGVKSFNYKITPKVNQNEVYEAVHNEMLRDSTISIFPEGGSHDQTHMLPLKPGVAVMALGSKAKGADVQIIPIGINYFAGHQFRSNAVVECGLPFKIEQELFDLYSSGTSDEERRENRRTAYAELVNQVQTALETVTINAPDYRTLTVLRTARRLFQGDIKLSLENYMKLYRRFVNSYHKWEQNESFQKLEKDIESYLNYAESLGFKDKQVRALPRTDSCFTIGWTLFDMIGSLLLFFVFLILFLPGIILNLPLFLRLECTIPREVKKAKEGSSVKNKALDVASSQRALLTLKFFPLLWLFYVVLSAVLLALFWEDETITGEWHDFITSNLGWILPLLFLIFFPFYSFFTFKLSEMFARRIKRFSAQIYITKEAFRNSFRHVCRYSLRNENERKQSISQTSNLRLRRRNLAVTTQEVILELTEDDPLWQEDPIITREQLLAERQKESDVIIEYLKRNESIDEEAISTFISTHGENMV